MILQYASDLHLEFPENETFLRNNPIQPRGDVLLLAGDIVPFTVMDRYRDFFDYLSDNFKQVYWVPGNHEYYHSDISDKPFQLNEAIRKNVHLINNQTIEVENQRIVFSTLWTAISPENQAEIFLRINDFRLIRFDETRFTIANYNELHKESIRFLETELTVKTTKKTIVVTHHVPTMEYYPAHYVGDILNEAFAAELKKLIEQTQPDCWIYGHSHCNTPAFRIKNTQLLTNQLGYVRYGENKTYTDAACIVL